MKLVLLTLFASSTILQAAIDESRIKIFKWRGPPLIDETIFTNPNSFDYDFDEDLIKSADTEDIYDQSVRQLPAFQVFRKGHDEGYTKVPIVTRRGNTWSTSADTRGPKDFFATSPMPVEPKFVTTTPSSITTTQPQTTTSAQFVPAMPFLRNGPRPQISQIFAKQPAPAFKAPDPSNHGPIWRKGGQIVFRTHESQTSTQRAPMIVQSQQSMRNSQDFSRLSRIQTIANDVANHIRHIQQERRPLLTQMKQPMMVNHVMTTRIPIIHRANHITQSSQPKPVIIQRGNEPHRGPTYNCRVLNPYVDGVPSNDHDSNCKMLYPGLSLDGSCNCIYTVSGRDQFGCAVGYNYSCKQN